MTATRAPGSHDIAIAEGDTLKHALGVLTRAFAAHGIEQPAADARYLVQGVLGIDAAELLRDPEVHVGRHADALQIAARRRLANEPVSRILGKRAFYGRQFTVTPDVLDPRADTETLVELVLASLANSGLSASSLTIADIGSGSGAIIVTLLAELPNARGIAIDVSPAALAVTRINAEAHGVEGRLKTIAMRGLSDICDAIDVVVSNPPYIPTGEIAGLAAGVRDFDPRLALDGGPDGLQIYREIASDISALSRPVWAFLEIGAGQQADVEQIFQGYGAAVRASKRDLGGHVRAVALEIHR